MKETKNLLFTKRNKHKKAALMLAMTVFTSIIPNINVVKAAEENANSTIVTVDPTIHYQTMDGWGTSLAWWGNMVGGWTMPGKSGQPARDELMDLVFDSEKGLGLNIVRYNVGGGDDPTHTHMKRIEAKVPGYKATEQGPYNWNADANQVWVLEQAIAKRQAAGDSITEMFSNTPPFWMTVSGCATGNTDASKDNLKADYYDDFAKYLVDVAKYFKDTKHITFDYLEPINEPATSYWEANSTKQEGCHFDPGTSQNKIYTEVYNQLQSQGLSNDIDLTGTDETSIDAAIDSYKKLSDPVKGYLTKMNSHTYEGSKRFELRDLADSNNKKLWMSEVCYGDEATSLTSMKTALQLSGSIQKDLRDMKATAWIVWQAVESHLENLRLKDKSGNWGLIQGVYEDAPVPDYHTGIDMNALGIKRGDYFITKQYYAMGQYSKFIKKGYSLVECDNESTIAALSPNADELVLVVQNPNTSSKNYSFYLSNLDNISSSVVSYRTSETESLAKLSNASISNGKYLNTVLPANSVTTYIIKANSGQKLYNHGTSTLVNDNVTGTGENEIDYSATGWSSYNKQLGAYSSDVHYSNTANSTYTFKFTGTKAKIYGSTAPDGGIASVSIDNGPEESFDTYSSQRQERQMLYATSTLPVGVHTIKVKVTGTKNNSANDTYVVLDYIQPINGELGTGDSAPVLKEVKEWDKKLIVQFRTVEGASSYKVKYGNQTGQYTKVLENITSNQAVIDNLVNGTTYYVVVSAVVNGVESAVSNERSAAPKQVNVSGSLYYVDAGSPVPTQLMNPGEEFGLNNSNTDQPYGVDPITGSKWGYTTTNGTWAKTDGNQFETLRCDTSDAALGNITYKFEVPNGNYNVALGFKDPWDNSGRKMDIVIEGAVKQQAYVTPKGVNDIKSYPVQVTDGELEVMVRRSAGVTGGGEDPHISWIIVNPEGKKTAVSITESQAATKVNKAPQLPATVEVKYTDGTSAQQAVTWGPIMSSKYSEAFKSFYAEGTVAGTTLKAKAKVNVVPANLVYYIDSAAKADNSLFKAVRDAVPALLNNVPDQAYDGSGNTWGYIETNTGTYDHTDEFNSVRYANDQTITYQMPVPNGNYTINLGFYDPWGNYNRKSDIEAEGTTLEQGIVVQQAQQTKSYSGVQVNDGVLNITIKRTAGTSQNPIVSWMMVSDDSKSAAEPKTADLNDIILSAGTLNPQFDPQLFNYTATVPHNIDNLVISAVTTDTGIILDDITTGSAVTITGLGSKGLVVGDNTVNVEIKDEVSTKTYTIVITREAAPVTVTQIADVKVTITVGTVPQLQQDIEVTYSNNTKKKVPVTWDKITTEQYSKTGEFTVYGTVEGTDIKAKATIIVEDKKSSDSSSSSSSNSTPTPTAAPAAAVPKENQPPKTQPTAPNEPKAAPMKIMLSTVTGIATGSGEDIQLTVKPYIQDGRTMIGMRDVANLLQIENKNIIWNAKEKKIKIQTKDKIIELKVNQKYALVNGKKVMLDAAPQIKNGSTVLPMAHIARILEIDMKFDANSKQVLITIEK